MAALSRAKCAALGFGCCSKEKQWSPRGSCASPSPPFTHMKAQGTIGHSMPARLGHVPRLKAPLHPGLPINYKGRRKKRVIYKTWRNSSQFHRVLRRESTCTCVHAQRHTHTTHTMLCHMSSGRLYKSSLQLDESSWELGVLGFL